MAMSSGIVIEVRTTATANNVNGGGFKTGASGTDFSQQDAAQYALTGITSAGAGNTILHASAAADMVGNVIHVISGTNLTASWFEITSVVAGVSITCSTNKAGTAISVGVGADGVANIGGALSLGHSSDATALGEFSTGSTFYIKSGTYTLGAAISGLTSGTSALPNRYIGYTATRGDSPTVAANMPLLDSGANDFTYPAAVVVSGISHTTTSANGVLTNAGCVFFNCKFANTSTTASRYAVNTSTSQCAFYRCEMISYRGRAIGCLGDLTNIANCYIHHSNEGVYITSGNSIGATIIGCIFEGIVSIAIRFTATNLNADLIMGNTFYGSTSDLGIGIQTTSNARAKVFINNIFYGMTTGFFSSGGTVELHKDDNNCFFSCGTNSSGYTLTGTVVTTDPTFTGVGELTGTAGVVAGSVLTVASATGIVPLQDYVYIISGTGATAGVYRINSNVGTALTLDIAPGGSGTDIVYRIITGHNYAVGSNMQALGAPGIFPASVAATTTSYLDIGAVQRKERASTDPGTANVKSGTAYTINDTALEGTLVSGGGGMSSGNGLGNPRIG